MLTKKRIVAIVLAMVMTLASIVCFAASVPKNETSIQKVVKRLEHANSDIKKSFQLDEDINGYKKVKYVDAIGMGGDIAREIDLLDQMVPLGSTEPTYYIINDSSEVMVLYKEANGNNVMLKSKKAGKEWDKSEKRAKGVPILDINAD